MKSSVFTVLATVLCTFVWQSQASTPLLCDEPNTESKCANKCSEQCPTYPPKACTKECGQGCFCKSGYSRDSNGKCVPTETCPVKCPDDQVFGQRCTDSCAEDYVRCAQTFYSCFCKPGLKRINGTCVPESNCFNCTENEVYNECSSPCNDNCPTGDDAGTACLAYCVKGCACKRGFKRDPKTNRCIPIEECDVKCPENSSYSCFCNDSCQKSQINCFQCLYGCACNEGFSRINGTCQPDALCPQKV